MQAEVDALGGACRGGGGRRMGGGGDVHRRARPGRRPDADRHRPAGRGRAAVRRPRQDGDPALAELLATAPEPVGQPVYVRSSEAGNRVFMTASRQIRCGRRRCRRSGGRVPSGPAGRRGDHRRRRPARYRHQRRSGHHLPMARAPLDDAWYRLCCAGARHYRELLAMLADDGQADTGYAQVGALCVTEQTGTLPGMAALLRVAAGHGSRVWGRSRRWLRVSRPGCSRRSRRAWLGSGSPGRPGSTDGPSGTACSARRWVAAPAGCPATPPLSRPETG